MKLNNRQVDILAIVGGAALGTTLGITLGLNLPQIVGPTEYNLVIDPAFSTDQQVVIQQAAESWVQAISDTSWKDRNYLPASWYLTIHTSVGVCPLDNDQVTCVRPVYSYIHCGQEPIAQGCTTDRTLVEIDVIPGAVVPNVARHEIGHVLGIAHLQPGNIMSNYTSLTPQEITSADVQAYMWLKKE